MTRHPDERQFQAMNERGDTGSVVNLLPQGQLDAVAVAAGTDKCSDRHDYMRFYEALLSPYRSLSFTFLELGVGKPKTRAPSLRVWQDFFPNARIVGVDINDANKAFESDRIHIDIGDASDPDTLRRLHDTWQPSIILDDASHIWSHQKTAFKTLFPLLPPNGVYIVEDIHTSFIPLHKTRLFADTGESLWEMMARLQSALAGDGRSVALNAEEQDLVSWIDAMYLTRKTIAIIKRSSPK